MAITSASAEKAQTRGRVANGRRRIETTIPTNTDDILGSDSWILSPGFAVVGDTPTMGFLAAMFFYDMSTIKSSDEVYVSRFRARQASRINYNVSAA